MVYRKFVTPARRATPGEPFSVPPAALHTDGKDAPLPNSPAVRNYVNVGVQIPRLQQRTRVVAAILACVILLAALLAHQFSSMDLDTRPPLPPGARPICGHVILFSAARHGSTWFIDSIERCRFSRHHPASITTGVTANASAPLTFSNSVFGETEPWKHERSSLHSASASQVADYVAANCSIKIFGSTLVANETRVRELISLALLRGLRLVVLRRDVRRAFKSFKRAKETGEWNAGVKVSAGARDFANASDTDLESALTKRERKYVQSVEDHFRRVEGLLRRAGVRDQVDRVWYEEERGKPYIYLPSNRCFVRNCNFLPPHSGDHWMDDDFDVAQSFDFLDS